MYGINYVRKKFYVTGHPDVTCYIFDLKHLGHIFYFLNSWDKFCKEFYSCSRISNEYCFNGGSDWNGKFIEIIIYS